MIHEACSNSSPYASVSTCSFTYFLKCVSTSQIPVGFDAHSNSDSHMDPQYELPKFKLIKTSTANDH
jgi:hypothetical protein